MEFKFSKKLPKSLDLAVIRLHNGRTTWLEVVRNRKILNFGLGDRKKITRRKLPYVFRRILMQAKANRFKKIALDFSEVLFISNSEVSQEHLARTLAVNFEMANYEFIAFKTQPKEGWNFVQKVVIVGNLAQSVRQELENGIIIGSEVNKTRDLSNTPGSDMTPKLWAQAAKNAMRGTKVKVKILGLKEIKGLKMGGLLSVGQGSGAEPQFIVLEYLNSGTERPIVLVGKGITFDTGGINIKPSEHIGDMHLDMSGGAAVIHALALAARLGINKNIVGLVPAAENMVSGGSYRPGDVVRTMSGKTIEVLNTDAEGRMVLADALTYAKKYNPRLVIDVATMTGAAMVALGTRASAIFTKDEALEKTLRELGEETGDYVWPLPLWDEYEDEIRGTFGDWANIGKTKYGGATHGAIFLYQWAKDFPLFAHIDIAPRMTAADGDFLARGAAGAPVRLLIRLLETY